MLDFFKKLIGQPPASSTTPNDVAASDSATLKDLLSPSGIKINPNSLEIGSKTSRTLFVFTYPRYLTTNWLSPIMSLDKEFNVSMFIHPIETTWIMNQLKKKVVQVQSQINERREKGLVREPRNLLGDEQ